MGDPTSEYERILVHAFGDGWKVLLAGAGVAGDKTACDQYRERVISLAREARPDLDDLELMQVAYAYNQWCRAQD